MRKRLVCAALGVLAAAATVRTEALPEELSPDALAAANAIIREVRLQRIAADDQIAQLRAELSRTKEQLGKTQLELTKADDELRVLRAAVY